MFKINTILNLQEKHQNTEIPNLYSSKSLFFTKHSQWGIKTKNLPKTIRLVCGHFIKVFYKTTTCPRQPLLSGPKGGCLWLYVIINTLKSNKVAKEKSAEAQNYLDFVIKIDFLIKWKILSVNLPGIKSKPDNKSKP